MMQLARRLAGKGRKLELTFIIQLFILDLVFFFRVVNWDRLQNREGRLLTSFLPVCSNKIFLQVFKVCSRGQLKEKQQLLYLLFMYIYSLVSINSDSSYSRCRTLVKLD